MVESTMFDISGPAFHSDDSFGMSLRDWFAGQALNGMLSNHGTFGLTSRFRPDAKMAYEIADAMLAERSATSTEGGK